MLVRHWLSAAAPLAFFVPALVVACSSDDNDATPSTPDGGVTLDEAGNPTPTTPGPLYIGSTRVFTADDSTGYLFATTSLAAGTPVDLAKAVEMEDAWVFGDAKPYFFTATIFEPTITQWTLDANGGFVKGPVVSFQNEGVAGTYSAAFTKVFSPTKSYFVDSASAQVVVWNPTDATFIKTIPIDVTAPAGVTMPGDATPELEINVTNDKIFVSVFWTSQSSGWTDFGGATRLVTIDPATDAVVGSADDTRCQTISPAGVAADGTAYYSPWDYHAAVRGVFGGTKGVPSCGLRIAPNTTTFDGAYNVDLTTLVGGKPAGSAYLLDDQTLLLHVWNNNLVNATPADWADKRFEAGYTWWRWTIGQPAATELPNQTPTVEGSTWAKFDGKLYSYAVNSEYTETTLLELTSDGTFVPAVKMPGWVAAAIQVR